MRKLISSVIIAFSTPLIAQQPTTNAPIPQIAVSSRAEVKVNPDRANIQISVQTRGETAASAAAENARKQKAVMDGLRALGIDAKDISTAGYNVYPEQRYEPNKEPVVVGYNVTNTLSVELKTISMVGQAIDVALAKGANMINSLQFYASNTEAARQEAIAMAVRKARADADAAARAAGGSITGMLEISVGSTYTPIPRPMDLRVKGAVAAQAVETPISAGDQIVSVDVSTRWLFSAK